jgi:cysteine desulfuration protein SufE
MPSLSEALEALELLPDWEQRFTYLFDLAKHLPAMPEALKTETTKVRGCTSQVWMTVGWEGEGADATLRLNLDSDALIVKGLLALVYLAYNGQTRAQIATINLTELLAPTGLLNNLSPNRRNGFASVLGTLRALAG